MKKAKVGRRTLTWGMCLAFLLPSLVLAEDGLIPAFPIERDEMTLERLAQPNTYFDKVGRRFAILGFESGMFEAWAYPLKLCRQFEFSFLLKRSTRPIAGREIVRFIEVTPAATRLTYTHQSFTVKVIFVTSVSDPGAVIFLDVDSTEPLTIVASFLPVLQPMWPAGLGGQYAVWDSGLKAYVISEPTGMNHGLVGSPAAQGISYTPAHMLSDQPNEFTIAVEKPEEAREKFIPMILAGGKGKMEEVKKTYEKLASDPGAVYSEAKNHYGVLRKNTLRLKTPVKKLDLAFEWAKVSLDNLRVYNPDLGQGLVAGLGVSGSSGRPGFGWFFGTDAYLNSLSLSSLGDFDAAREALAFTQKWQREDGKMAHELSQAAGYINWFRDYPYGYIHGDTTPFYIAAAYDYYLRSGDREFIRKSWPSLVQAYEWCLTTDGEGDGLMDNRKAGLGFLEFGSLTRIQTDIYLAAVWIRAALSMEKLAAAVGETTFARKAAASYEKALAAFEARFWDEENGHYAFALNADGQKVKEITPWCVVPLLWKIGSPIRAAKALEKICSSELTTDWGVRGLTNRSTLYEPLNYNYGSVWPFLTGYAAMALYQHGHSLQGFRLLMSNADHIFDNALGHATELYSGARHVWPEEAVAHQGFSAGGVVLPLVRGLLGLDGQASARQVILAPSFPPDWPEVHIENVRLGDERFSFDYKKNKGMIRLEVKSRPGNLFSLDFAPALTGGTRVVRASVNGRAVRPAIDLPGEHPSADARVRVPSIKLTGHDTVVVEFEPTVEILPPSIDSAVGDYDKGLKIIRVASEGKTLKIGVEGLAGHEYVLRITRSDLVAEVAGATLGEGCLQIRIPGEKARRFVRHELVIQLKL